MIYRLKQLWCGYLGHPYPTITVPIVGRRPQDPEVDTTFCKGCGAQLYTEWTDNAGTESR